ncbi:unnamed protein product [Pylaiella littoralis]
MPHDPAIVTPPQQQQHQQHEARKEHEDHHPPPPPPPAAAAPPAETLAQFQGDRAGCARATASDEGNDGVGQVVEVVVGQLQRTTMAPPVQGVVLAPVVEATTTAVVPAVFIGHHHYHQQQLSRAPHEGGGCAEQPQQSSTVGGLPALPTPSADTDIAHTTCGTTSAIAATVGGDGGPRRGSGACTAAAVSNSGVCDYISSSSAYFPAVAPAATAAVSSTNPDTDQPAEIGPGATKACAGAAATPSLLYATTAVQGGVLTPPALSTSLHCASPLPQSQAAPPEHHDPTTPALDTAGAGTAVPFPSPPSLSPADKVESPVPTAPWLVERARSVKAAVEEAVRGVVPINSGGRAGVSRVDEDRDAAGASGWVAPGEGERKQGGRERDAMEFPDEVAAKVPRLVADLHASLGRGVSTSEAKAWVLALDRLGEGLDREKLLEACLDVSRDVLRPDASLAPSSNPVAGVPATTEAATLQGVPETEVATLQQSRSSSPAVPSGAATVAASGARKGAMVTAAAAAMAASLLRDAVRPEDASIPSCSSEAGGIGTPASKLTWPPPTAALKTSPVLPAPAAPSPAAGGEHAAAAAAAAGVDVSRDPPPSLNSSSSASPAVVQATAGTAVERGEAAREEDVSGTLWPPENDPGGYSPPATLKPPGKQPTTATPPPPPPLPCALLTPSPAGAVLASAAPPSTGVPVASAPAVEGGAASEEDHISRGSSWPDVSSSSAAVEVLATTAPAPAPTEVVEGGDFFYDQEGEMEEEEEVKEVEVEELRAAAMLEASAASSSGAAPDAEMTVAGEVRAPGYVGGHTAGSSRDRDTSVGTHSPTTASETNQGDAAVAATAAAAAAAAAATATATAAAATCNGAAVDCVVGGSTLCSDGPNISNGGGSSGGGGAATLGGVVVGNVASSPVRRRKVVQRHPIGESHSTCGSGGEVSQAWVPTVTVAASATAVAGEREATDSDATTTTPGGSASTASTHFGGGTPAMAAATQTLVSEEAEGEGSDALVASPAGSSGGSGGGGGSGAGGAGGRRGARRNASKFPDDVIAKVPCLSADLNAAVGRYVSLQEVKDIVRSLRRCGAGMDRQALLGGCLELMDKSRNSAPARLSSSNGEVTSSAPASAPASAAAAAAVATSSPPQNRLFLSGTGGSTSSGDSARTIPTERRRRCNDAATTATINAASSASSCSPSAAEALAPTAPAVPAAPAAAAAVAADKPHARVIGRPPKRKRGRPKKNELGQYYSSGGSAAGAGAEGENDGVGGGGGREVAAVAGAESPTSKEVKVTEAAAMGDGAVRRRRSDGGRGGSGGGGGAPTPPRRASKRVRQPCGLIPESVVAKVPRLLMDLEASLGYRVFADDAKARCRELRRCGEGLSQEGLCDALVSLLLRQPPFHNDAAACNGGGDVGGGGGGGSDSGSASGVGGGGSQESESGPVVGRGEKKEGPIGTRLLPRSAPLDGTGLMRPMAVERGCGGGDSGGERKTNSSDKQQEEEEEEEEEEQEDEEEQEEEEELLITDAANSAPLAPPPPQPQPQPPPGQQHASAVAVTNPGGGEVSPATAAAAAVSAVVKGNKTENHERKKAKTTAGEKETSKEGGEGGAAKRKGSAGGDDADAAAAAAGAGAGADAARRRRGRSPPNANKRPRRLSGIFPESVISKVPRLAIDLSTRLGCGVSTEQAKAACRELDRCGERLTCEQLVEACLGFFLISRDGCAASEEAERESAAEMSLPPSSTAPLDAAGPHGDGEKKALIPNSVIAKIPALLVDLETFMGHPVSMEETENRVRKLDRCGENLTQQELCDACVSLFLCCDNLGGGAGGGGVGTGGGSDDCVGGVGGGVACRVSSSPEGPRIDPRSTAVPTTANLLPDEGLSGWLPPLRLNGSDAGSGGRKEQGKGRGSRGGVGDRPSLEAAVGRRRQSGVGSRRGAASSSPPARAGVAWSNGSGGRSSSSGSSGSSRNGKSSPNGSGKKRGRNAGAGAAATAAVNGARKPRKKRASHGGSKSKSNSNNNNNAVSSIGSSSGKRKAAKDSKLSKAHLECDVGEFVVFPTPQTSPVPFLLGKVLEKNLLTYEDTGGPARTEVTVHWYTPKKTTMATSTAKRAVRPGAASMSSAAAAAAEATLSVARYSAGGWSGVFVPAGEGGGTKRLRIDTGEEDLAAAMVVFPKLLHSNGGMPASVRETVTKAVVATAVASEQRKERQRKQEKQTKQQQQQQQQQQRRKNDPKEATDEKKKAGEDNLGAAAAAAVPAATPPTIGRGLGVARGDDDTAATAAAAVAAAAVAARKKGGEEGWKTDDSADDFM